MPMTDDGIPFCSGGPTLDGDYSAPPSHPLGWPVGFVMHPDGSCCETWLNADSSAPVPGDQVIAIEGGPGKQSASVIVERVKRYCTNYRAFPPPPPPPPPRHVGVTSGPQSTQGVDPCVAAATLRAIGRTAEADRLEAMCAAGRVHAGAGPAGVEPAVAGAVSGQTKKVLAYAGAAAGGVAILGAAAWFLLRR